MSEKPPRQQLPWEDWEIDILERHYQTKGAAWCGRNIGRTTQAIHTRAREAIVRTEDRSKRYVTIHEASIICETNHQQVYSAAERQGVLRKRYYGSLVPKKWVLKYAADLKRWRAVDQLDWYTRPDIQRIFRISGNGIAATWARGLGMYGFAFVERVEMRQGHPRSRRPNGEPAYATHFNPWDVEDLVRDIRAKKPVLTERCGLMLMALRQGYSARIIRSPRILHTITIDDTLSLTPFPKAIGTWLRRTKVLESAIAGRQATLTQYGEEVADDLLNSGAWSVIRSPS